MCNINDFAYVFILWLLLFEIYKKGNEIMSETLEKALNELTYSINRLEGLWRLNYENGIKQQAEAKTFTVLQAEKLTNSQKENHAEILNTVKDHIDDKINGHMIGISKQLADQAGAFLQVIHVLEQKLAAQEEQKRLSDSFAKRLMNGFKK